VNRAVITGIGVIAPSGVDAEQHWSTTLAGTVCDDGHVPGFDATAHVDPRLLVQTDRWTWMSLCAAQQAFDDAKYDPNDGDAYATSVALAAGYGGCEFGQREIQELFRQGPQAVSAYQSIAWFYAASAGQTSIRYGTKGPATVVVTGHAGGLDSVGVARRTVRRGATAVLTGGTEAPLAPYALVAQQTSGRISGGSYRPFDVSADGYTPAEGGAILLVEDATAAQERGAPHAYAEIAGYAATHDAHHDSAAPPDSHHLARAMRLALADAGVSASDVDAVFADGAGIPAHDELEAAAIRDVFGTASVPVTAPQGFIGRLGSGSAINVATALLSMRDGVLPAVGNLSTPGSYGLDLVRAPRSARLDTILINARGYGGFNACLVLRRLPERWQR
jgi:minimal PKS chain-length factor (CLF/KS beta)